MQWENRQKSFCLFPWTSILGIRIVNSNHFEELQTYSTLSVTCHINFIVAHCLITEQQIKVVLSFLRIIFTEKQIEIKKPWYENKLQKEKN